MTLFRRMRSKIARTWSLYRSDFRNLDGTQIALLILLSLLAVFMLLPLVFIFNHAFKPLHELFLFPPTFFVKQATMQNFIDLLNASQDTFLPVTRFILNSVIVTVLSTVGMVVLGALCAYPLSKHPFPGRKLVFGTILLSIMIAVETMGIPRYIVVKYLGIMNTYWGHVLPILALPVGVFLMKQFMDQVPNELMEAAKLDGASEWRIFTRIMIPIVSPAMATITILSFQTAWGNAETSALFMQNDAMKTLPFYVESLTSNLANSVARQGVAAAASLIMFIPNLIIFLLSQRKVIQTMAHSGIK
ncbi:carbohydrate ABC transporter permease [Paenibacillus dendritiformis]|uniref:carbohydrate ABC transporter permease n=1 Tax=Paenibacillus dendritiformis TaxID=130049 RepID=UPI001059A6DD|nr:carbohydrate ABC transporter permease [Paenibacillus dendritiformis]TDL57613.1 carbohydrate ABC transporter permease [Paenibacillus dendritiformis]